MRREKILKASREKKAIRKAKRNGEPADFEMPGALTGNDGKLVAGYKPNKRKKELEKTISATENGKPKESQEETAEKLVKAALGENVFEREEGNISPDTPITNKKPESLGAAVRSEEKREENWLPEARNLIGREIIISKSEKLKIVAVNNDGSFKVRTIKGKEHWENNWTKEDLMEIINPMEIRRDKRSRSSKAGQPFELSSENYQSPQLTREEIEELYSGAKDIQDREENDPDYDISELKIGAKAENGIGKEQAFENSIGYIRSLKEHIKSHIDRDFEKNIFNNRYEISGKDINWDKFDGEEQKILEAELKKAQEEIDGYLKSKKKESGENKITREEFYKEYGPKGRNICGVKLYSKKSREKWIILKGFSEGSNKALIEFSRGEEEKKIGLEALEDLLKEYVLDKPKEEKELENITEEEFFLRYGVKSGKLFTRKEDRNMDPEDLWDYFIVTGFDQESQKVKITDYRAKYIKNGKPVGGVVAGKKNISISEFEERLEKYEKRNGRAEENGGNETESEIEIGVEKKKELIPAEDFEKLVGFARNTCARLREELEKEGLFEGYSSERRKNEFLKSLLGPYLDSKLKQRYSLDDEKLKGETNKILDELFK